MKANGLTQGSMESILSRIVEYANLTIADSAEDNSEFYSGKKLAYHEVLGVIQNELLSSDIDLKLYGLDIDLDKVL